jgi:hypothetical protein
VPVRAVDHLHARPISRASSKIETPAASASIHPSVPAYGAFVLDPDGHNVEVVNHNQG